MDNWRSLFERDMDDGVGPAELGTRYCEIARGAVPVSSNAARKWAESQRDRVRRERQARLQQDGGYAQRVAVLERDESPSGDAPADPGATGEQQNRYDERAGIWDAQAKTSERITSLDDLLRFFEVDTAVWDVAEWRANKWEVGAKNAAFELQVAPLYQVKARFRRKQAVIDARAEILAMLDDARVGMPAFPAIILARSFGGVLLEIAVADLHIGKLGWSEETGENYDSRIAESAFMVGLEDLIAKTSVYRVDRILFPIGNDLLTSDNAEASTTAQTRQDVDSRFHKSFRIARRLMTTAIERLREIAPVDALVIPGNHDTIAAFTLGEALDCWFHSAADVSIDNRARLRKCYAFPGIMIGLTHGNREKHADLPLIFASEYADEWKQATAERTVQVGHWHTQALKEFHGCSVRWLSSLSGADAYHAHQGYVGNRKMSHAFVFTSDDGTIAQYNFTAPKALYTP